MTDTNDKFRALVLSALMVLSVFAGTIALTGSAAAEHETQTWFDADDHLTSGATFWQGQDVFINATGSANADDSLQIRRVNDDGEVGGLATGFVVNDSTHNETVSTSNLDGFYVLVNNTHILEWNNGDVSGAYLKGGTSEQSNVSAAEFEVATQDLSASFDEDDLPVSTGDTATIELDSNRPTYQVNITAEGLDEDDLSDIFNASGTGNDVVAGSDTDADDDESIQLNTTGSGDIEANFSSFDEPGSYTFEIDVSDTTASASASVDVSEEDVEMNFPQGVISEEEGDVAAIPITLSDTDEGYLWVGGQDVNYLERVAFTDEDGDGQVVILMNTRFVGTSDGDSSVGSGGYFTPEGSDDTVDSVTRVDSGNITDTDDLNNPIQWTGLSDPIEPGNYPLTLASEAVEPNVTDNGELVINEEEGVATLDLTQRSTDGISTYVAPTANADIDVDDEEEVQELLDSMSPASTIPGDQQTGDRLIIQVNASGIYGTVSDESGLSSVYGNAATAQQYGTYLNISSQVGNNRQSTLIDITDSGSDAQLITEGAVPDNSFLVSVDTRNENFGDGKQYTVSFQVGNEDVTPNPNPYVDDDEEERVETDVTFQDTEAEFDNVQDETLQVVQDSNATVSGSTNAAPGEELTIRLRKTGDSPFLNTQTATVNADGTFSAEFDTSEIPVDTEFTAEVREGGNSVSDEVDAQIVDEPTTTTPGTTTPATTTPATTTPATTTTTTTTTTTDEPETATPGGQPGFGVAIAIVALLGAALLALRRRD